MKAFIVGLLAAVSLALGQDSVEQNIAPSSTAAITFGGQNLLPIMKEEQESMNENYKSSNWVPSAELKKSFPYYLSGYDYDGRPMVTKSGMWDYLGVIKKGPQEIKALEKYFSNVFSSLENWADKSPTGEIAILLDYNNYNVHRSDTRESLKMQLRIFRKLYEFQNKIAYALIVNANYKTQATLELARPVLGGLMEKLEIFGTNRAKWLPMVLRKFPRDQIASTYGGFEKFVPLSET